LQSSYFKVSYDDFGKIFNIEEIDIKTGVKIKNYRTVTFYPANLSVSSDESIERAIKGINKEMNEHIQWLKAHKHADRVKILKDKVKRDCEWLRDIGYCPGVENYSSHLQNDVGHHYVYTILDYFPEDYNLFIDESHITLQQLRCQGASDYSRKKNLVEYGYRLPSCYENSPLSYEEFERRYKTVVYVSATPGKCELQQAGENIVEQIIRPTGLLDPTIEVVYSNPVDHMVESIQPVIERGEKVLVTALTCRMAEELNKYLQDLGYRSVFLDARDKTLDRLGLINKLSTNKADVLIGVNLIREGISIPQASLMCIFDADKCGFLRSEKSLIQYIGRVARNVNGHVIMYAGRMVGDMERAIKQTECRRAVQEKYNKEHGITPVNAEENRSTSIVSTSFLEELKKSKLTKTERKKLYEEMKKAANEQRFEDAIKYRDLLGVS